MRQTAKLVAARTAAKKAMPSSHASFPDESLYEALESRGWWWDASGGVWKKGNKPSTSMFKDDAGNPTGLLRVRLMGMPADAEAFMQKCVVTGWTLAEKSEPYENRKGPGYRWYLTYKKD